MGLDGSNGVVDADSKPSNQPGHECSLPVTSVFAEWVASVDTSAITPSVRVKVNELILDYLGITAAAAKTSESTPPIVAAISSLSPGHPNGNCTVVATGSGYAPQVAALLNGTFAHSLDFDDTHAPSTLHPGVTSISAALACAESLPGARLDNDRFLLSVMVAYEITCRLGTELGYAAYSRGFHNTSTAGIFGAIGAISVLKGLPAATIANAFGLAGSRAAGSMQYLDNGSHNKRLHPGFACHDAFVCVALAEQGVVGATRIIEGKMGFLHAYSPAVDAMNLSRLVDGLGSEWRFTATALKPYPACRMTHCVIEIAGDMGTKYPAKEVKRIEIKLKTANMSLVGERTPNKVHPKTEVDGQFSAYFQCAHAWLYGSDQGVRAYTRLDDREIYELSDKIECVVDNDEPATAEMGCAMAVEFENGKREEIKMKYALGEKEHPFEREQVEKKFRACVASFWDEDRMAKVMSAVNEICDGGKGGGVRELMALVA
ncbi:hypothetical protein DV737_g4211, partial [Chaetothyriales sp. CBS 132003]